MSFLPALVAGPIVRAAYFPAALARPLAEPIPIGPVLLLILVGLVKKVVDRQLRATCSSNPVFTESPTIYGGA